MDKILKPGQAYRLHDCQQTGGVYVTVAPGCVIIIQRVHFSDCKPRSDGEPAHLLQISGPAAGPPVPIRVLVEDVDCVSVAPVVEDMVNLFNVAGAVDNHLILRRVVCHGPTTKAGSGIIFDKGTHYAEAIGCRVTGTSGVGIAIHGGCNNIVRASAVKNCKYAGFSMHNYYPDDPFTGNSIDRKTCVASGNDPDFWIA
jgi:hypothetical protein